LRRADAEDPEIDALVGASAATATGTLAAVSAESAASAQQPAVQPADVPAETPKKKGRRERKAEQKRAELQAKEARLTADAEARATLYEDDAQRSAAADGADGYTERKSFFELIRPETQAGSSAKRRARAAMDAAMTARMRGDNVRAARLLSDALRLDNSLMYDNYFTSLASNVTGIDGAGALQVILDRRQRSSFIELESKKKQDARVTQHMAVTRQHNPYMAAFESLLFALIHSLGVILLLLVVNGSYQNTVGLLSPEALQTLSPAYQQVATQPNLPLPLSAVFVGGFIGGIAALIGLLTQTTAIHLFARFGLRGVGTYAHQLTMIVRLYNKVVPFVYLLSYLVIAVFFFSQASLLVLCPLPLAIGLVLYAINTMAKLIAQAYDFSVGGGLMALLLGSVAVVIVGIVLSVLTGPAISGILANAVR
jgi:hypothetical protein